MNKLCRILALSLCIAMTIVLLVACGGQEVTREEWNRALAMEDMKTYDSTIEVKSEIGGKKTEIKTSYKRDGYKCKLTSKDAEGVVNEEYYSKEDEKYYYYKNENGKWSRQAILEIRYIEKTDFIKMLSGGSVDYEKYTFERGRYTATWEILGISTTQSVVIKGKKLAEVKCVIKGESMSIESVAKIKYLLVSVKLPAID